MGSGRRGSLSSSSFRAASDYASAAAAGATGIGAGASESPSTRYYEGYASAHVPAGYAMPFGLPPPLHRAPFSRDSSEFAWPAEPPSPHAPPRPYAPTAGGDEDAAAVAAAAAAGDTPAPDATVAAAAASAAAIAAAAAEPLRGSLLFGLGGMAAAEASTASRLAEHRVLVDEEHVRLEWAMAALDAAGARTRRHWRRVSRLAEAEASVGEEEEEDEEEGDGGGGGERLTGLHKHCRWKLAGNEHEGQEPGRFRPVLQPVVAAAQGSRSLQQPSSSSSLSASTMSMEDVGLQLARKCSRYIVDIVKTEAEGDGLADGGSGGSRGGGGNGGGGAGEIDDNEDNDDDVWGVIGPLDPGSIPPEDDGADDAYGSSGAVGSGAVGTGGTGGGGGGGRIGVIEEVTSSGESPATRARREEEERRLVNERVKQMAAAVASSFAPEFGGSGGGGGGGGARVAGRGGGPRVDLGPGAGRWNRAVAIAAEAVSGMGVSEMVVLVTPKGNRRGRLSLVDKVGVVVFLVLIFVICLLFLLFLSLVFGFWFFVGIVITSVASIFTVFFSFFFACFFFSCLLKTLDMMTEPLGRKSVRIYTVLQKQCVYVYVYVSG